MSFYFVFNLKQKKKKMIQGTDEIKRYDEKHGRLLLLILLCTKGLKITEHKTAVFCKNSECCRKIIYI